MGFHRKVLPKKLRKHGLIS